MAKYFLNDTAISSCSTAAVDRDMTTTQGTPTTEAPTTQSESFVELLVFYRTVGAAGASGDYSVSVDLSSIDSDTEIRWRLKRLNFTCAVQESSGYSTVYTTSGIKTDTISFSPSWAAGDRLALAIELRRVPGAHGNKTATININDADSFVEEPVSGSGTATVAVTIGGVSGSASATHTAPVFDATAAPTIGGVTASASGTTSGPTFTATAAPTIGGATGSASATFDPGTFTATVAPTIGGATGSASATFVAPVFDATAAPTIGGVTASASGTTSEPTFTATAALTIGGATGSASATFTAPVFDATAAPTIGGATGSSSATFVAPVFDATAAPTIGGATGSASASSQATFTATAAPTIGGATGSASATFTAPVFDATAAPTIGGATGSASATFVAPVFDATAAPTIGGATGSASATFDSGTFTATAAPTIGGATVSSSATFVAPVFDATAAPTIGGATGSASASSAATSTATAAPTIGGTTGSASATFDPGTKTATAAPTIGGATVFALATFDSGTFTATAAPTIGGATGSASVTFVAPVFTATAAPTIGGAIASASGVFAILTLTDGLLFGYKLDEASGIALDVLGVNDLSEVGGAVPAVSGILGRGRSFDGIVSLASSDDVAFDLGDFFTVSFWFKIAPTAVFDVAILDKRTTGAGWEIQIDVNGDGNATIKTFAWDGVAADGGGSFFFGVADDQWHHCLILHDAGLSEREIYVDDASFGPSSMTVNPEPNAENFVVGLGGALQLDEIYAWDRVLPRADVTKLAAGDQGSTYPFVLTKRSDFYYRLMSMQTSRT